MDLATIFLILHAIAQVVVNVTPTPDADHPVAKAYKVIELLAGVITPLVKK